MRVLVACEFSGVVRRAFRALGDALAVASDAGQWDLLLAYPPCTYLAVSGARWFKASKERERQQFNGLYFFRRLLELSIKHKCLENPVSVASTFIRKPDQIIQPWQFGHGEVKTTCLWLDNLPPLLPTKIVKGRIARAHRASPGPDRWKERSRTLPGIAAAKAAQWGALHG